jgi:hypothetical protein
VIVDCTSATSCTVNIAKSKWVEVVCSLATACTIVFDDVDELNVICAGAVYCSVTGTDTTNASMLNHYIDCSGAGTCILDTKFVSTMQYSCKGATVSCTITLQKTLLNKIIV